MKSTPKKQVQKQPQPQPNVTHNTVSHSNFIGVQFDPAIVKTVQTVADGLLNLSKLFAAQNITIGSMVTIGDNSKPKDQNYDSNN